MINQIENLVTSLINGFLSQGYKAEICLNNYINSSSKTNSNQHQFELNENIIFETCNNEQGASSLNKIYYWRFCNRQRFASFLYVLSEVHELFLCRNHCTYRQLYYRNVDIECNILQIQAAVSDVCQVLGTTSWDMGIFAAGKCFISGPLLVYMSNGDVIDCNEFRGPTLMPPNFTYIDKFETTAKIVLVVEKNTVFQNLIACDIFSMLNGNIILVTARGYPDLCTRWILHKLWIENNLIIYTLVDGDPYGIEIMLIYRYGSLAQGLDTFNLTCPQLKWLGIHPSDVKHLTAPIEPLSTHDHNKIKSLLRRTYLDNRIRTELLLLRRLQCKVKIDNISPNMFSAFIIDYIINKIKRQLML